MVLLLFHKFRLCGTHEDGQTFSRSDRSASKRDGNGPALFRRECWESNCDPVGAAKDMSLLSLLIYYQRTRSEDEKRGRPGEGNIYALSMTDSETLNHVRHCGYIRRGARGG
jgi:hypothetical protein